jgi:hypothetical protein
MERLKMEKGSCQNESIKRRGLINVEDESKYVKNKRKCVEGKLKIKKQYSKQEKNMIGY